MSTNNENSDNNSSDDQHILGIVHRLATEEVEGQNASGGNAAAAAAAVVEASMNNESIGYCHVCDKQVPINSNSFTCSECNGGFIELFENDNRPPASSPTHHNHHQQQQQQQQETNDPQRVRLESMRLLNESVKNYVISKIQISSFYYIVLSFSTEHVKFIADALTSFVWSKYESKYSHVFYEPSDESRSKFSQLSCRHTIRSNPCHSGAISCNI